MFPEFPFITPWAAGAATGFSDDPGDRVLPTLASVINNYKVTSYFLDYLFILKILWSFEAF